MGIIVDISLQEWIVLGALLLCTFFQLYFYARYLAAPARKMRKDKKNAQSVNDRMVNIPGVTVVLCAHNESYNISHYLQALLTQDYPEYEVIVVDDGSEDETRAVLESYMALESRLRMTFVPQGARVGSTKKLGLTLAAKAAKYDYLLLTDADCVPESNQWIREMIKPLLSTPEGMGKEVALGFSPYYMEKGHLNRLVRYDTLFNGLHYMGAALCGHPYMGVGRNLAYRKSLFFESGGFTHLMTSMAGDDDLFVNHVATKANTAVVLSREAYTWSLAKTTMKEWWQQKRRHVSVSPLYRWGTKFRLALEPLSRGLFYALVIGMIAYSLPLTAYRIPVSLIAAVGLFLIRWWVQTSVINASAHRMGLHRFSMWSVLWFDIVLPLVNLWMLCVPKRKKKIW